MNIIVKVLIDRNHGGFLEIKDGKTIQTQTPVNYPSETTLQELATANQVANPNAGQDREPQTVPMVFDQHVRLVDAKLVTLMNSYE